jgi:hypothetical protein
VPGAIRRVIDGHVVDILYVELPEELCPAYEESVRWLMSLIVNEALRLRAVEDEINKRVHVES